MCTVTKAHFMMWVKVNIYTYKNSRNIHALSCMCACTHIHYAHTFPDLHHHKFMLIMADTDAPLYAHTHTSALTYMYVVDMDAHTQVHSHVQLCTLVTDTVLVLQGRTSQSYAHAEDTLFSCSYKYSRTVFLSSSDPADCPQQPCTAPWSTSTP